MKLGRVSLRSREQGFEPKLASDLFKYAELVFSGIFLASKSWLLPSSDVIITSLEKIVKAFEDVIQVDLIRQRWEEIKILQNAPIMLTTAI